MMRRVFYFGWVKGLEPSAFRSTIRRSDQLSYTHRTGSEYSMVSVPCLDYIPQLLGDLEAINRPAIINHIDFARFIFAKSAHAETSAQEVHSLPYAFGIAP